MRNEWFVFSKNDLLLVTLTNFITFISDCSKNKYESLKNIVFNYNQS